MVDNTELLVSIKKDGKIRNFFIKSNRFLLEKYASCFYDIRDYDKKLDILKSIWSQEFSVELQFYQNSPESIKFNSKQSMMLFFLRFND